MYEVDPTKFKAKHAPRPENRRVVYSPHAVAAIKLLALTGCRVSEILNLRWREVDLERGVLHLPDSKTGRKIVLLGSATERILQSLPRIGVFVVAGDDPTKRRTDLKRPWDAIRTRAGLTGVRLHDLRHSYASVGAGAGLGLPVIGKLLGHSQVETTARYSHLADDPLKRAAHVISAQIAESMGV